MEQQQKQAPTFESVWALLEKHAQELEKSAQERKESSAKFDREMEKTRADFDRRSADFDRRSAEFDRQMNNLKEQVAGITKSNGDFAEEYFFNTFEKGQQNFFGEKFDRIIRGKGKIVEDEYDVVMINGKTAGIIEVKYRARKDDIPKALKKAETFRINFPEYRNHKIYLALAALTINSTLERECIKEGIAVIKQVGDKVIVYDKHLKAF